MKFNEIAVVFVMVFVGAIIAQTPAENSSKKFSCRGRPSGYYADVETGCQVYHMCDSIGRQFSYACPNTTLFQQRMLVCDHWYMVNCSKSEQDYDANLLIGQRDKPFVTEHENHMRTPRPDILTIPLTPDFFRNLKNYKTQYPISGHISNSIAGNDEQDSSSNDDLSEHRFNIPTKWSTEYSTTTKPIKENYTLQTASSTYPKNVIATKKTNKIPPSTIHISNTGETGHKRRNQHKTAVQRSKNFNENRLANGHQKPFDRILPPATVNTKFNSVIEASPTTTVKSIIKVRKEHRISTSSPKSTYKGTGDAKEVAIKLNQKEVKDEPSVIKFIKQFIPDDSFNTTVRTIDEIISINKELPGSILIKEETSENITQAAKINFDLSESKKTAQKTLSDKQEDIKTNSNKTLESSQSTRRSFDTADSDELNIDDDVTYNAPPRILLPPRNAYAKISTVTKGPPIYYEWKWAVPAFDLEPPKADDNDANDTETSSTLTKKPTEPTPTPKGPVTQRSLDDHTNISGISNYEPSDYFVPKYVFPLDKAHRGYDDNDSYTSFQVKIPLENEEDEERLPNYGENSKCPQCHPAFVIPGTCKPCVMIRQ